MTLLFNARPEKAEICFYHPNLLYKNKVDVIRLMICAYSPHPSNAEKRKLIHFLGIRYVEKYLGT